MRFFFLELEYGYGLVHEGYEVVRLSVYVLLARHFWPELLAGVVLVCVHGKGGERHEVYTVAVLERGEVGVAQRQAYDIAYTSPVAGLCAHPQHVMVAPLYVPAVVGRQRIEDDVGPGATVVDVAEDVEEVY